MFLKRNQGVICLDIGGTNIRGCWFSSSSRGDILLERRPRSRDGTLQVIMGIIHKLMEDCRTRISIQAIGIASAGPLDAEKGMYLSTANMPEMDMFPLGEFIEDTFSLPCVMENDAQAAAVGEFFYHGNIKADNLLLITLGTGVGSGVILKGKLWRGAHITGPELGHIFMGGHKRCGCGQRGCAETLLNSKALIEIFQEERGEVLSTEEIIFLAQSDDKGMMSVLIRYGRRLGRFLCILQTIFGIKYICISGGLSRLFPYMETSVWEVLKKEMDKRKWWLPLKIYPAQQPDMSALYGMFEILKRGKEICW